MIAISATGSGRCHGFSLIELLVVLLILVLLTGLMPLAIERMVPARRIAAVCQDLESRLRDLQSLALASGRETVLTPDTLHLPADITLRLLDNVSGRSLTDLTFFTDGSSTGGRFEVAYGARHRTIIVSRILGRVREEP
jgi:general secretion pathway protein H